MSLQVGSQGPLVAAWQRVMVERFNSYALERDGEPLRIDAYFGYSDRDVQREYERRTEQTIDGVVSDADLVALGLQAAPTPPPPTHRALTFRGTGGIVGADYTSRLAQMTGSHEVPILYPAAMGGISVGVAHDITAYKNVERLSALTEELRRKLTAGEDPIGCIEALGADA
ncbi:MAG: hypothetical protein ACPGVG_11780, partial [Mycobacterium sp.]